jgi:hypothetical protein
MNKKIATEIAIGVILVITVMTMVFLYFDGKKKETSTIRVPISSVVDKSEIPTTAEEQNDKSKENNISSIQKSEKVLKKISENKCDFLKEFETESWFTEMVNLHKNELPKGDEGKFYIDYSELGRKQACLYENYFIFTPFEDLGGGGALYKYDIVQKKLEGAPESEENPYFSDNMTGITNDYVSFEGGGGSGECFYENHGKYYYKENKVEITEECNFCMKSIPDKNDCKKVKKIFK